MQRYTRFARWYDVISAEPVYRAGRRAAIPALGLRAGDRVLDIGCGTGLNLPALDEAVGPGGLVVGIDRSAEMLEVAAARTARHGLRQVTLVEADAMRLTSARVERVTSDENAHGFDAVVFTYSLSLMENLDAAWRSARALLRHDARVAVVDMQPPHGLARVAAPAAYLACWLGGADIHARPWTLVEQDLDDVRRWSLRGGHVQVRVGTLQVGRPDMHSDGTRPLAGRDRE